MTHVDAQERRRAVAHDFRGLENRAISTKTDDEFDVRNLDVLAQLVEVNVRCRLERLELRIETHGLCSGGSQFASNDNRRIKRRWSTRVGDDEERTCHAVTPSRSMLRGPSILAHPATLWNRRTQVLHDFRARRRWATP